MAPSYWTCSDCNFAEFRQITFEAVLIYQKIKKVSIVLFKGDPKVEVRVHAKNVNAVIEIVESGLTHLQELDQKGYYFNSNYQAFPVDVRGYGKLDLVKNALSSNISEAILQSYVDEPLVHVMNSVDEIEAAKEALKILEKVDRFAQEIAKKLWGEEETKKICGR